MYKEITFTEFSQAFYTMNREDNFSHDALKALFDFYESLEDDTGEGFELDVIAICCDWSEMHIDDAADDYRINVDIYDDDNERHEYIKETLENNAMVIVVGGDNVLVESHWT